MATDLVGRTDSGTLAIIPRPLIFVRKHVPDSDPGCALQSTSMPAIRRRNVPICRPMAEDGMRKCSAGLVPRRGRGGAWQNPPRQFAVPNHNSGFSYLGVPAPAGKSDCYESMSRDSDPR